MLANIFTSTLDGKLENDSHSTLLNRRWIDDILAMVKKEADAKEPFGKLKSSHFNVGFTVEF